MPNRHVPPSIKETTFSCPHCGAYAPQPWSDVRAVPRADKEGPPKLWVKADLESIHRDDEIDADVKPKLVATIERLIAGVIEYEEKGNSPWSKEVYNLNLSKCFACKKVAIWVHDSLVYPPQKTGPEVNPDLPEDVLRDYEEAQSILALSPRGAAALLRLAIQKLCKDLGESGKNLDSDIASLVKKGLSAMVQQSLDIVRVIGNESVHPGTIDLRDNRDTALQLFSLVNLIAEQMITNPKHVKALFATLPPEKRAAIEKRDKKDKKE